MIPDYSLIREDVIESLQMYVKHHVPTGSFLGAVLSNDLRDAFMRGDDDNLATLFHIVAYVCNEIPSECWGSPERVNEWLDNWQEVVR